MGTEEFNAADRLKYVRAIWDEIPPARPAAIRLYLDCVAEAVSKYDRVLPATRTTEFFLKALARCLESRTESLGKVVDKEDVDNSYNLLRTTAAMILVYNHRDFYEAGKPIPDCALPRVMPGKGPCPYH